MFCIWLWKWQQLVTLALVTVMRRHWWPLVAMAAPPQTTGSLLCRSLPSNVSATLEMELLQLHLQPCGSRCRIMAHAQGHLWLSDLRVISCHPFYFSSIPLSFWFFQRIQNFISYLMYEILFVWNSQCGFYFLTGIWLIQKAKFLMSSIFK